MPDLSLSLVLGLESRCFAVVANCAQIGVSAGGPLDDDGGVVFSLSFCILVSDRSLLERFILAKTLAKLVEDLDFLGIAEVSVLIDFFSDCAESCPGLVEVIFRWRPLEGDDGGDCTLDWRSPSGLLLAAAWGWSGGSNGTVCVLLFEAHGLVMLSS